MGDDVVDLDDPEVARTHPRFAERVCVPEERAMLAAAREPSVLLWTLFAAKEAAYKVAAKLGPAPGFAHRAFVVAADLASVRFEGQRFALAIAHGEGFVHAVAWTGAGDVASAVSRIGAEDDPSREARQLAARRLAPRLGVDPSELTIAREPLAGSWDGFGPPRLSVRDAPSAVDVSLSHDGRFVSFAAMLAPGAG